MDTAIAKGKSDASLLELSNFNECLSKQKSEQIDEVGDQFTGMLKDIFGIFKVFM